MNCNLTYSVSQSNTLNMNYIAEISVGAISLPQQQPLQISFLLDSQTSIKTGRANKITTRLILNVSDLKKGKGWANSCLPDKVQGQKDIVTDKYEWCLTK